MRRSLVLIAVLALVAGACGDDDAGVEVTNVWSRASASMQEAAAIYMTITAGDTDIALVDVAVPSDVAQMSMLHETAMDADGAMSMSPVTSIEIPAGETVMLEPGGYHVMAMPLTEALTVGETFDVTLTFDDGTEMIVQAEVRDE